MYDLNKINDCLNTNIIGQAIIQYDSLVSTYAKSRNIFNTCDDGAVVLSENQSKWCVKRNNEWICYPGKNIYLSIILKPLANNHLISKYDVIGCASVCKAIKELYNIESKVKWPNDIYINECKVSSIASSLISKNNAPDGVILSIGINCNMEKEELELLGEIKKSSTSLQVEISDEIIREVLVGEILNNIELYYKELITKNSLHNAVCFCNQNSKLVNNTIEIVKRGKKTKRKVFVKGIDSEGWLIVKNENQIEEILSPGEIVITYEN